MSNAEWQARDVAVHWHPCTQMQDHEWLPVLPIRRADGIWLEDFDGNRYIDAVSSWWVNLFGHCNPRINRALKEQLDTLEHVIMAGLTHEPAVALAERLTQVTPPGLSRVFYAENGSSAVEIALKMSFHYWLNRGQERRRKFITLGNSYHGETLGALAVGDVDLFKRTYAPLLMEPIVVPSPDCYHREPGTSWQAHSRAMFAHMERALAEHADDVCAVIVEPLVQCAGGMRMYDAVYLELLREACDRYGVHLIADEIAVGFGRTGTLFACEHADISPDFMCLSKGLSGGYLPLAAVLTTEDVYSAFYHRFEAMKGFLHSHSYQGNALCCRAALAVLDIFAEDDVLGRNRELAGVMAEALAPLADHPHVGEVRQHGMIAAVELVKDKATGEPYPWQERRGVTIFRHAATREVLLRPLGNVVYIMPPYVIGPDELRHVATVAAEGIDKATAD